MEEREERKKHAAFLSTARSETSDESDTTLPSSGHVSYCMLRVHEASMLSVLFRIQYEARSNILVFCFIQRECLSVGLLQADSL